MRTVSALLLVFALALVGCPQDPITLQVIDGENGASTRCELQIPNRLLAEVANELSERMELGAAVALGEDVDRGLRVHFSGSAPTCREAFDAFAADQGLAVREGEVQGRPRLELISNS
ncbi:MAG: hypothetical protein HKN04_01855 [Rhodothermaceae bacterium]|nr:hypothetical protein [Rhodothermaceae bacterium]